MKHTYKYNMNEYESELENYKELGLSLQESLDKMNIETAEHGSDDIIVFSSFNCINDIMIAILKIYKEYHCSLCQFKRKKMDGIVGE